MKVLIAGGGTGGHLYPGIAIARELMKNPTNEVLFVGTEQGIEARVLPREGLRVKFIPAGKLKGMDFFSKLKTFAKLPAGFIRSFQLLQEERPDIVIGVGGYASAPLGAAAGILRFPLIVVEPNSYPGLANKILGRTAVSVALCFPGTAAKDFFPPEKTVLLGPLVRKGIDQGDRTKACERFGFDPNGFTLLVMGGSGGAHAINMAMKQAAQKLTRIRNLQVLHATGEHDAPDVLTGYRLAGLKATVLPYIHAMEDAYAVADLVIARSGATTVAELAVCGKRAILIPFPYAADNHQEYNARTLASRGSGEVLLQKDLTPDLLAEVIKKHAEHPNAPVGVRMASTAAEEIVRICNDHVQKN
ncbi:MAG: undecaprenyldiphospho-muramoylpentapeptide beta-N-acetylglucosaminyltransferase [Nitrospirota bacterium]